MYICFRIGDHYHCYRIPIITLPIEFPKGPGPWNYPALFEDAMLIASLRAAAERAQDDKVKESLLSGVENALAAMQERAGDHVRISDEPMEGLARP